MQVGNVGKEVDDAALLALFGHCGTVSTAWDLHAVSYWSRVAG